MNTSRLVLTAVLALVSTASGLTAQSLYIDFGDHSGSRPSSSYAAAAGVAGYWNEIHPLGANQPLLDVDQLPTRATYSESSCSYYFGNYPTTQGEDAELLDDGFSYCSQPAPIDEVRGLAAGTYLLYVYPPPDGVGGSLTITLPSGGTVDGSNSITWQTPLPTFPGSYVDWMTGTRVLHLPNDDSIVRLDVQLPRLSGLQLVRLADATPFCFGHLGGCPCGVGQPGAGCPSSFNPSGATLAGAGSLQVSSDTLQFTASGVLSSGFCLLFQGTTAPGDGLGLPFGDGVRCAGGPLKRIASKSAVGGVFQYPLAGDPSVSVRGAVPASGGFRTYQLRYRNAASYCTSDTFNSTNGVAVEWRP